MQAGPAQLLFLHHGDVETGSRAVQRRGVPARAAPDHHHVMAAAHGIQHTDDPRKS